MTYPKIYSFPASLLKLTDSWHDALKSTIKIASAAFKSLCESSIKSLGASLSASSLHDSLRGPATGVRCVRVSRPLL